MFGAVPDSKTTEYPVPLLRVLVVDDDADDRLLITDLLAEVPSVASVDIATSFAEGRERILEAGHDVYLVDYRLGARTGLDLIGEAADRSSGPFIVLTGYSSPETDRAAAAVGAYDYLEKSEIDAEGLARSIRYAVSSWRAQAELRRRADRQAALAKLSRAALDRPDVSSFLVLALDAVTDALEATHGGITEYHASPTTRAEVGVAVDGSPDVLAPIVLGDGSHWGVLAIQVDPMRSSSGDVVFVELVANLVAAVVDQHRVVAHRNRLVEILEATPDFVGTMTIDGSVTYLNRAGRTLGRGDDLQSEPDFRFFYPEPTYRMFEDEAFPHAVEHGVWSGRAVVLGRDGTEIPVSEVLIAHRDRGGNVTHISAVAHDLTEDLAAEKAAAEQIAFQASLLDQVRNAVIATDLSGRITYWNQAATEMFGWNPDEVLGAPMLDLVSADPEAAAAAAAEVATDLLEDGVWEGEGTLRRRDGSTFLARMADSLLCDDEGTPIGIIGVKADVTQVRAVETEARRQEAMAASVLASVHFPMAVLDPDGFVTAVNRAWSEFAIDNGGDPERCGVGVNYLAVCDAADDEPGAREARQGILAVLEGRKAAFALEYECSSPTEERWFEMEAQPIPGIGAVVVHWNVTAEHLHRRALEETLQAKDRFIASLSHELRTPLTAVVGLAEELRSGSHSAEDTREFQALIADQARELSMLIDDLLIGARIDSGTITYRPGRVVVTRELSDVLAPWRTTGVDVTVDDASSVVAYADAGRTRQVLRNLITNAIRHGAAPIVVSTAASEDEVSITVTDHGSGVPESVLDRLFEPYASFTGVEGLPASVGLGLHVSRQLAEGMNGSLEYRRERDTTVFELRLPAHH